MNRPMEESVTASGQAIRPIAVYRGTRREPTRRTPPRVALSVVILCLPLAATLRGDITIGAQRPTTLHVPDSYDPDVPAPLVLALHGLWRQPSSPAAVSEAWVRMIPLSDELGFLLAYPEALYQGGEWRWTFTGEDSAYIRALIEETVSRLHVDRDRIFLFGYSLGGEMAYQASCDHADLVAAFVSAAARNRTGCLPAGLDALAILGTEDSRYSEGVDSIAAVATSNGCSPTIDELRNALDLITEHPGAETTIRRFQDCPAEATTELWSIEGAGHTPGWTSHGRSTAFAFHATDWLLRHPERPSPEAAFTLSREVGVAPLELTLDASLSVDPPGGEIAAYHWSVAGQDLAGGPVMDTALAEPGRQTVSLRVVTADERVSLATTRLVEVLPLVDDVSPWTVADVGEPAFPGGARWSSGDDASCLAVCAGGLAGAAGASDQFHFVHQSASGNVAISARVAELDAEEQLASVGVMLRESMEPDARYAAVLVEKSASGTTWVRMRYRDETGSRSHSVSGDAVALPDAWLRMRRAGSELIGLSSADGVTWAEVGRVRVDLTAGFLAGFAAAGRDDTPEEPYTPITATLCSLQLEATRLRRGDCNDDGAVDISDAVSTLSWLFLGGEIPACLAATNTNGDAGTDTSDASYLLNHLFLGGPPPVAPYPGCGPSILPADDDLGCSTPPKACRGEEGDRGIF